MVLFSGGYFFGIGIRALLGEVDSKLILHKVSDQNAVTVFKY